MCLLQLFSKLRCVFLDAQIWWWCGWWWWWWWSRWSHAYKNSEEQAKRSGCCQLRHSHVLFFPLFISKQLYLNSVWSSVKPGPARRRETRPDRPKMRPGQAPLASAICDWTDGTDDKRSLTYVGILHTGVGPAIVCRCPQLLASLDSTAELWNSVGNIV